MEEMEMVERRKHHIKELLEKLELNHNEVVELLDFWKSEKLLNVVVKPPSRPMNYEFPDMYILPPNSEGVKNFALILNLIEFKKEDDLRNGAEYDEHYMRELWKQLGYEIYPSEKDQSNNINQKDLKEILKNFRKKCACQSVKSIVVFIGSHGAWNEVAASDSVLELYGEILEEFSTENCRNSCPSLNEIPKIFLINTCQKLTNGRNVVLADKMNNTLVCTAQLPGSKSDRDDYKGSSFVYYLTYVFMNYANKRNLRELLDMLKLVMSNIKEEDVPATQSESEFQVPAIYDYGMQELYFFLDHEGDYPVLDPTMQVTSLSDITESSTWDDLSVSIKREMRRKTILFQGEEMKLERLRQFWNVDGKLLLKLRIGKVPTLVNNQVPDQVEYYIHRTLRSRSRLKSSVFQQGCDDVFVVDGMEKHQLTTLVAGPETDVSGNQIKSLTVRFILLEYERDFESICKLTSSPVHLIRFKGNVYEWVKSYRSVKNLQKYVDDAQDCFSEEELASKENSVHIIPDSPGMGKTVLLANVAHQINKEKPNMLIRFIVMKELVQDLSNMQFTLEAIISLIAEQSSDFECGREIVRHILTSEPCILMFDGFDEVLLHQMDTAKSILKTIVTLKSAQVFVTTRPHMREELENTLHVLGYTINPFMEVDQVKFLLKFWELKDATMNEDLVQFANSCVKAMNSNMIDFERNVAGIPLQCRLLAETYTDQAIRFSQLGFSDINSQPLGQINSVFEMYEMHMNMRLDNLKSKVEAIKNIHTYYAMELLFPEHAHQFHSLKTSYLSLPDVCAVGFLEATNSEDIRFVHRTFAELFIAWFAVEMKTRRHILSFLINELLATKPRDEFIPTPFGITQLGPSFIFNYPVITYFINGFTKRNVKNCEGKDQTHRVSTFMDSIHYEQVSRIFYASAVVDYQYVPLTVASCFDTSQVEEKGHADIYELLLISAKCSSVALMKTFCGQRDLTKLKSPSKVNSFELTPLHVAVQRGHYNLVEFLVQKYEPVLTSLRYLLHFCVLETLTENEKVIIDKVQIIKLLSNKSNVWKDEEVSDGTVPLLQENVHCELLKSVLFCGADVNSLDRNGNTILHKITENPVSPDVYHWFVVSLSERKFKYFNQSNWRKVNPLHCAAERVLLLPETLKLFHSNGTDFNGLDEKNASPLFYAIRPWVSVSIIRALIELGSDWKKRNSSRETVLHICANQGHYDAMKYFLETFEMDVNATDEKRNTPLHFAVMRRSEHFQSIQQLLITSGADVNANSWKCPTHEKNTMINRLKKALRMKPFSNNLLPQNYTPFKIALESGEGLDLRIIKLMVKHGLSVKANEASEALVDLLSNNKNSLEINKEFAQVLQFLIGKGGKIKDDIWESEGVQRNMPAIIKATDMSCLWPHLKTSRLLTDFELEQIQNISKDTVNKCERFYKAVQSKKGSFVRICILMITSNQMGCLLLLRESLQNDRRMFGAPPNFTNQLSHHQQNSSLNIMAIITTNPKLTILRIQDTIQETVDVKETEISSKLQKAIHDKDMIVVKVRVVTTQFLTKLEESGKGRCKIFLVCSRVNEDVESCHVTTDSLTTWDAISPHYFDNFNGYFRLFRGSYCKMNLFFETPAMLSRLSQIPWSGKIPPYGHSVVRFQAGHIEVGFHSKDYLCPTVFQYFFPDKLVFQGISIEKLKEYARFGHNIGVFGEGDVDNLDFVVVEECHQFDEICKQTSENVHLIEYEQEKGDFRHVRTWGWDENIQWFLKKPLCEGFPHCDCASGNQNLVVGLLLETFTYHIFVCRFESLVSIQELTPTTLAYTKLNNAEELFNIRDLLKRLGGAQQAEHTDFLEHSHREQIVQLVTEQLSTFLVESELYHVAINTLFPVLAKQTTVVGGLEKYQQLGILTQIENDSLVFVHQSLAWYFIAKLFMGLNKNAEFETIANALKKEVFQNCVEPQKVRLSTEEDVKSLYVSVNSSKHLLCTYEFTNIMCFRFVDALLGKNSDKDNISIFMYLKSILAKKPEGKQWIQACVSANLYNLLQLILSFNIKSLSAAFESEDLVVLAVCHANLPITRLVAEQFRKKTKRKLTEIKIFLDDDEISTVSLAAWRGNYCLVDFLLKDDEIRNQHLTHEKLGEVGRYCVENSCNNSGYELIERKCIVSLLFQTDVTFTKYIKLSFRGIHVDFLVHLINLGMDIHAKNTKNQNILHRCPKYLTPQEYHQVVKIMHSKNIKSIARLLQEFDSTGNTAFHVAVQNLELLDETLAIFSEAGINFNALSFFKESVFVYAAKNFRSARLLNTLYRYGADIHVRNTFGDPASVYCKHNQTALRYLSSRGVEIENSNEVGSSQWS